MFQEGAGRLGQGLTVNDRLQTLDLLSCNMGNDGLANLVLSVNETINNSLTDLNIGANGIQGAEGGRQVTLLLQRFPVLRVLNLDFNNLGPLGCRALAPVLTLPELVLKSLLLQSCNLGGNDGVKYLIPDGEVNRSLTFLALGHNDISDLGRESFLSLVSRCTNLDHLHGVWGLSPDIQRRLNLLLDRKRLCTTATALAGSTFPVLYRAMEEAHHHEHGLSAIFVILQNDGDDLFYTALNRAMD